MANLNKLLKQAQKMQEKVQQEMEQLVVEDSAGGGMVLVKMSGQKLLIKVTIDPTLLVPTEREMLEDLIVAAINQCQKKVDEELQDKLGGLAGGMGIPGLM